MLPFSYLIAFGFSSPAALWWLVAAAAPFVIHFLSRRRHRETTWAAMEYLAAAMRRSRRRLQFEQLLLLLARAAVVVFVVLAAAEPYLDQGGFAFSPAGLRTHRMLVIDGSYSMACKDERGASRFQTAKSLARRLVEDSPPGDGFTLLLMSSPPRAVVKTPALEPAAFLAELDALDMPQTSFDLPATLERIEETLNAARRETPGLERAEVYFFSDLCKVGWQLKFAGAADENEFRRRLKRVAEAASLAVVDVGRGDVENRAVADVRADEPFSTVGRPVGITAVLKNYSTRPRPETAVELRIDGHRTAAQNVDLAANGSAAVKFSQVFSAPGRHVVEIRIPADRLEVDDRRFLALPVKQCVKVLCVDGGPAGSSAGAAARGVATRGGSCDYLAVALDPQTNAAQPSQVCPRVVPESGLMETDLAEYDCVFLANVAQFTSGEANSLSRYLQNGGGLVFFLGDRVIPDRYNLLAESDKDRGRLLPARLQGPIEQNRQGLDPLDYRHSIVEKFRGREQAGLLTTPLAKFYKLSLPKDSRAGVVLATNESEPLVAAENIGCGRVVLVGTSADATWGAMPLWPSFVPLVHEILAYAVGGQIEEQNRLVGDVLEGPLADNALFSPPASGAVEIETPAGAAVKATVQTHDGRSTWSFDGTDLSGIYRIHSSGGKPEQAVSGESDEKEKDRSGPVFAVNVDTVESDLTKLSEAQLRGGPLAGVPLKYLTDWREPEAAPAASGRRPARLSGILLWSLFGLLLCEGFLAWRFGRQTS